MINNFSIGIVCFIKESACAAYVTNCIDGSMLQDENSDDHCDLVGKKEGD